MSKLILISIILICLSAGALCERRRELLTKAETEGKGIQWRGNSTKGLNSHDQLFEHESYPDNFSWCDQNGTSYCTVSRNQHIPQYCGSCWAFGSISALGDRIKIARKAKGIEITPSVQHLLNCGDAGSCYGGSIDGPYQWIHRISQKGAGISYESSQPYLACSSDSKEGFCKEIDTTCTPANVARTCGSFSQEGGPCFGLNAYPNATIAEYGSISGFRAMQKEIYARGPIACGIDAMPILNYEGGIQKEKGEQVDHVISVVGWGFDPDPAQGHYWIVRNSWGEFWGEMGYIRVARGALQLEEQCSWAVLGEFTAPEFNNQKACHEGGDNCRYESEESKKKTEFLKFLNGR
jgi:cathepsin X